MDNKDHNNEKDRLEEFLKNSFEDYSDTPSSNVWDNIDKGLSAEGAAGGGSFWSISPKWIALATIIVFLGIAQMFYFNHKINNLEGKVKEQSSQIKDFKNNKKNTNSLNHQGLSNKSDENSSVKSIKKQRKEGSQQELLENSNNFKGNQSNKTERNSKQDLNKEDNKQNLRTDKKQKSTTPKLKHEINELAINKEKFIKLQNKDLNFHKNHKEKEAFILEQEKAIANKSNQEFKKEKAALTSQDENSLILNKDKFLTNPKTIEEIVSDDKKKDLESSLPLIKSIPALSVNFALKETYFGQIQKRQSVQPLPQLLNQTNKIAIIPFYQPTASWSIIKEVKDQRRRRDNRSIPESEQEIQNPYISHIAGINLRIPVRNKLGFETGLAYFTGSYEATHKASFKVEDIRPPSSSGGSGGSGSNPPFSLPDQVTFRYDLHCNASTHDVSVILDKNSMEDIVLSGQDKIKLKISTNTKTKRLSIPLLLSYSTNNGSWGFIGKTGLVYNYLLNKEISITEVKSDSFLQFDPNQIPEITSIDTSNSSWDYLLSAGINYAINQNCKIEISPTFKTSIISGQKTKHIETSNLFAGLNTGFVYQF